MIFHENCLLEEEKMSQNLSSAAGALRVNCKYTESRYWTVHEMSVLSALASDDDDLVFKDT